MCAIVLVLFGSSAHGAALQDSLVPVLCESIDSERQHCAANTSSGVLMAKSTGPSACLLGKSWGYDVTRACGLWMAVVANFW